MHDLDFSFRDNCNNKDIKQINKKYVSKCRAGIIAFDILSRRFHYKLEVPTIPCCIIIFSLLCGSKWRRSSVKLKGQLRRKLNRTNGLCRRIWPYILYRYHCQFLRSSSIPPKLFEKFLLGLYWNWSIRTDLLEIFHFEIYLKNILKNVLCCLFVNNTMIEKVLTQIFIVIMYYWYPSINYELFYLNTTMLQELVDQLII